MRLISSEIGSLLRILQRPRSWRWFVISSARRWKSPSPFPHRSRHGPVDGGQSPPRCGRETFTRNIASSLTTLTAPRPYRQSRGAVECVFSEVSPKPRNLNSRSRRTKTGIPRSAALLSRWRDRRRFCSHDRQPPFAGRKGSAGTRVRANSGIACCSRVSARSAHCQRGALNLANRADQNKPSI